MNYLQAAGLISEIYLSSSIHATANVIDACNAHLLSRGSQILNRENQS
jgi:hypothetical protein